MKHIVLFKFDQKIDNVVVGKLFEDTYNNLKNTHKVINDYSFKFNCLDNENNMDLILFVSIENHQGLGAYLMHEDHQDLLKKVKNLGLIDKSVIDIDNI